MKNKFFVENKILTWEEVSEIHKSRNGIYQKNGKLISLLTDFGKLTPYYPDFTGNTENEIFYTGAGRRGDQKLDIWNRAMINEVNTKNNFPLFCKLKIGVWKFLGYWQISNAEYIFDEKNERMIWKFKLIQVNS
jgi:hypothetical protein